MVVELKEVIEKATTKEESMEQKEQERKMSGGIKIVNN
jgi:hypothetical protein